MIDYKVNHLLSIVACLFSFLLCASAFSAPPNVVVILTDDQGWGDLSINGNVNLATPNIDSLARDGATVDHFYVCQVCAPTRAEFLTGRYYPRTGVSGVSRGEGRLNPDETTIADVFVENGYATGCFGKWHNGTQAPYHPLDRGFDEFYGFTSGHWGHYFSPPLDHNRQHTRGRGFIVDDVTDHALDFIRANRRRPFFCYLPLNTPHSPMMVPDRYYAKFDGVDPEMRHREPQREDVMMTRAALAMCENIDWNVGRVLKRLDELELSDNTIVVFFCDNGPNSYRWNGGMKGRKGSIDEGGLRSPLFIRFPGVIPSGSHVTPIAGAIDLLPTLTDLASMSAPVPASADRAIDGRSIATLLRGDTVEWPDRSLLSIRRDQVSVRTQRFRMDNEGRLFDIPKDPGQQRDVAAEYPDVVGKLQRQANEHRRTMRACFAANQGRPFTVGYAPLTSLPARDGIAHGSIQRSSKAPNNSFFRDWTSTDDSITWDVQVGRSGMYEVIVYYTCTQSDRGCRIHVAFESEEATRSVSSRVTESFNPKLYDKSKERVAKSHYYVKDFRPLSLGTLQLDGGRGTLRLSGSDQQGSGLIDVHSIDVVLKPEN